MNRRTKPRAAPLLITERTIWQKINYEFIREFIGPVLFLLLTGILIVLSQWVILNRRGDSFKVGSPSPETYRVITHMRYDDQDSAQTLRDMVSDSVVGVTVRDVSAKNRLRRRLEAIRDMNAPESKPFIAYLPERLLNAIASLRDSDKSRILTLSYQAGTAYIGRLEAEKVYRSNTALMTSILWEEINKLNASQHDANFIYQILAGLGNLNFRTDEDLTDLARQAAIREVPAIDRRLEPGDVIVSRGDTVTEQIASLLRMQGYTEDVFPFRQLFSVIVCVLVLPLWLDILSKGAGDHKPTWWCVVFAIVIAWVCEVLATRGGVYGGGVLPAVVVSYLCVRGYMAFCVAFIASISGVFIITGQPFSHFILLSVIAMSASTAGFYLLRNLESRRQLYRRITIMAVIMTLMKMAMRFVQGAPLIRDHFRLFIPLGEFWQEMGIYFLLEIFTANIVTFILPNVEEFLGVLSVMSLREVSHPSSPLLRDLQRQAPGTYQHSLTIATLMEAVGLELGMDVNLLRAGAYYHDIGKLRKPQFFVENQGGGTNLHDDMTPNLSYITIISHVKDGLELAWEAKLPRRIRDFIAEHHGTTCTFYFYKKALAEGQKVTRSDFTYPGPRPQSKETALLMIVDSVEAAVRAANIRDINAEDKDQTSEAIRKIVNQVVASKLNENQFDDVDLTQKDLATIKETLVSVLTSMFHTRKVKKIESRKS